MKHISSISRVVLASSIALGTIAATAAAATAAPSVSVTSQLQPSPQPAASGIWDATTKAYLASLPATSQGQHNAYVLGLQGALIQRGYSLEGTGYFGDATSAAVKDWQRRHHINPSGLVGTATWASLFDSWVMPAVNLQISPGQTWKEGQDNNSRYGRSIINELSYTFTSWAPPGDVSRDERYTGTEVVFVQRLQTRLGISPSGIIGPKTSAALNALRIVAGCYCN